MWHDLETVETPDLPAAKAALRAARSDADTALGRWRQQQDAQDRRCASPRPLSRSEYRLKWNADGTRATVQWREVSRPACGHGIPIIYDCPDCALGELDAEIVESARLTHRRENRPQAAGELHPDLRALLDFERRPR